MPVPQTCWEGPRVQSTVVLAVGLGPNSGNLAVFGLTAPLRLIPENCAPPAFDPVTHGQQRARSYNADCDASGSHRRHRILPCKSNREGCHTSTTQEVVDTIPHSQAQGGIGAPGHTSRLPQAAPDAHLWRRRGCAVRSVLVVDSEAMCVNLIVALRVDRPNSHPGVLGCLSFASVAARKRC